jgi:hypothetical protein
MGLAARRVTEEPRAGAVGLYLQVEAGRDPVGPVVGDGVDLGLGERALCHAPVTAYSPEAVQSEDLQLDLHLIRPGSGAAIGHLLRPSRRTGSLGR